MSYKWLTGPTIARGRVVSSRIGVIASWELPYGLWVLNLSLLKRTVMDLNPQDISPAPAQKSLNDKMSEFKNVHFSNNKGMKVVPVLFSYNILFIDNNVYLICNCDNWFIPESTSLPLVYFACRASTSFSIILTASSPINSNILYESSCVFKSEHWLLPSFIRFYILLTTTD